jgi:hypothetical protein
MVCARQSCCSDSRRNLNELWGALGVSSLRKIPGAEVSLLFRAFVMVVCWKSDRSRRHEGPVAAIQCAHRAMEKAVRFETLQIAFSTGGGNRYRARRRPHSRDGEGVPHPHVMRCVEAGWWSEPVTLWRRNQATPLSTTRRTNTSSDVRLANRLSYTAQASTGTNAGAV